MADITTRKDQHISIVLDEDVKARNVTAGFDDITFAHVALPELDLNAIDISAEFLSHRLAAPLLISSMTGGPARSEAINHHIAEAAQHLKIAFGVGSQRIALEQQGAAGFTKNLRKIAPDVPILANLGGAQLRGPGGIDLARRAIDMIEANAIIIHLNPLQEAVQEGGDTDWRNLRDTLAGLVGKSTVPVIVKEVGFGISGEIAKKLLTCGIAHIDVAGAGGTSWAAVEAARAKAPRTRAVAEAFRDWGIPTATAIRDVSAQCPEAIIIASGGIRDGIDAAKAIHLGATVVGQAASTLAAALESTKALVEHFEILAQQLRIACFCTGSKDLAALKAARRL